MCKRRLGSTVHDYIELRFGIGDLAENVGARLVEFGEIGFSNENIGFRFGPHFVLRAADFDKAFQECGIVLVNLELFVGIGEAVVKRPGASDKVELAAAKFSESGDGLRFGSLAAKQVPARKRNGLLDHQFLIGERVGWNGNKTTSDCVEPCPRILPGAGLGHALLHGLPSCARGLEGGIALQDIAEDVVER